MRVRTNMCEQREMIVFTFDDLLRAMDCINDSTLYKKVHCNESTVTIYI